MMKYLSLSIITFALILISNMSYGEQSCQSTGFVKLPDGILKSQDVSAIAKIDENGSLLVIGSDEGSSIQFLKKDRDESYGVHAPTIDLFNNTQEQGEEMDIEGLAVNADSLYVIGSHSSKRKKVKEDNEYQINREKFHENKIKDEKDRDWLYRLKIDPQGKVEGELERKTLKLIIETDPVLSRFSKLPSKENGVDIEGLATKNNNLYVGFRGPVFRNNYVPIMKLKFDNINSTYDPNAYEVLYIQLGGRGIRDITSVSRGFLILAGPVGDGAASYQLYHWDGKDIIPGNDRRPQDIGNISLLCEIATPEDGKAEGIVDLSTDGDTSYNLIIVYDGVVNPDNLMQRFQVSKP